jgi:hypothetical protein
MEWAQVYRMTLSTRGYTLHNNAWSFEAHFTATLAGSVHDVREKLREIGIPYFQELIRERYGQDIPPEKIRGEFEQEEPALTPSPDISIVPIEMTYRGKVHDATELPTRTLPADIISGITEEQRYLQENFLSVDMDALKSAGVWNLPALPVSDWQGLTVGQAWREIWGGGRVGLRGFDPRYWRWLWA